MAFQPGTLLGPYEVLAPLGAGGMGEVYRARDTRLDRTVAIKVLHSALVATPDLKARFEREARVISQLQHPNICVLHDVGHDGGADFLVMEFLEGETLGDRLRRGPLPLPELLKTAVEIADALERAHRAGVVHRDLKPGNVMLTKSGAKLLDFGLAKPLSAAVAAGPASGTSASVFAAAMTQTSPARSATSPLSSAGSVVGTVQYMSPEQVQGLEADARSDIFAFGVMLFEMTTGKRAFEGKTQASLVGQILALEPPPVTALQPDAPPALARVVRLCLEKDPDERFQCAHDLKLQLQGLHETPRAKPAEAEARSRRPALTIALASGLALAIAVAAYFGYAALQPQPVYRSTLAPPDKTSYVSTLTVSGPAVVSPDGKKIAFLARDDKGGMQLYVRSLSSLTAQPLAGTVNATYPFWSADSRNIGFFAEGKLKRIDAGGGPAQALAEASAARGGTWAADGTIVYAPTTAGPLMRVSANGGTPVPATQMASGETSHRWPWFLPDGKHLIFTARGSANRIAVADITAVTHKLLFENATNAIYANGHLLFLREGTLVAQPFSLRSLEMTGDVVPIAERVDTNGNVNRGIFSASANGVLVFQAGQNIAGWPLTWIDRDGKHQGDLGQPTRFAGPAISPDGTRVALSINDTANSNEDVWIYDLVRGTKTRVTFDPARDAYPCWTADGKHLLFESNRKGHPDIYMKAADNSSPEELLYSDSNEKAWITVSHDGRWVAFMHQGEKTGWDIWGMPLQGDRKPFPVVQTQFVEVEPQLSPDGKWLAYSSNESGAFETYVTPFPGGGAKWQVSTSGGGAPRWRGDGKELYFYSNRTRLMAVDVAAEGTSVTLGTPHELFAASAQDGPTGPYDVTRDGKKFLINSYFTSDGTESLTLVVNWTAELKK